MSAHPNRSRSRRGPGENPKPEQIRKMRQLHVLTQTEAAELVYSTLRAWQQWEGGQRRMHPAIWQWFRHQVLERANAPRPDNQT